MNAPLNAADWIDANFGNPDGRFNSNHMEAAYCAGYEAALVQVELARKALTAILANTTGEEKAIADCAIDALASLEGMKP